MDSNARTQPGLRRAGFPVRMTGMFALLLVVGVGASVLGVRGWLVLPLVVLAIVVVTVLAWLSVWREWRAVRRLARVAAVWGLTPPDQAALDRDGVPHPTDPELAALAGGMRALAARLLDCGQRERQFTRDASHELRSPLTTVRLSVDRLLGAPGLAAADLHTVRSLRRASLELEVMVEALLVLARDPHGCAGGEYFVVNDVVRAEVGAAREVLADRPVELAFEDSPRFALEGSARGFAVLCSQLIRNAYQQVDAGRIDVHLSPQALSVSNPTPLPIAASSRAQHAREASRHGFELAIARRISKRFAWPLELETGAADVARIRFAPWFPPEIVDAPPTARRAKGLRLPP